MRMERFLGYDWKKSDYFFVKRNLNRPKISSVVALNNLHRSCL